jgi:Fanconi anemia group M protein
LEFLRHPLIKEGAVERREYQERIAEVCARDNTLVCLPTGLGKSVIAALAIAKRLEASGGKAVVLAPTKPLVLQHYANFRKILNLGDEEFGLATGEIPPDKRDMVWRKRVVFSTPQTFMNDLILGRIDLSEIAILVIDEAHRAVGDYAYSYICERYSSEPRSLIVGLTASPGSSKEAIEEVCRNIRARRVEVRTLSSPDVRPYIGGIKIEREEIKLPEDFLRARSLLSGFIRRALRGAKELGLLGDWDLERPTAKRILALCEELRKSSGGGSDPRLKDAIAGLYASLHALKALELLETQSLASFKEYIDGLRAKYEGRRARSLRGFLEDRDALEAIGLVEGLLQQGREHPKISRAIEVVKRELGNGAGRVIVFANYRSTARRLAEELGAAGDGIRSARLVGQVDKGGDKGMSQKEQAAILEGFRSGEYNVLVATQIGEEGLDISECGAVVLYDCVPSAIRFIQRRGRTGRREPGKAILLVAKGTSDEAYYWIAKRREGEMGRALAGMASKAPPRGQFTLEGFVGAGERPGRGGPDVRIVVDSREMGSGVVRELSRLGAKLECRSLEIGDYLVSDKVAVERKMGEDFASSLIDGRLFSQAAELSSAYEAPIILIEGEYLYTGRDVRPEAILGAISSLLVDYGIRIMWTRDSSESALFIYSLAKREQIEEGRTVRLRSEKKPASLREMQEFLVAGLPYVDAVRARRLLAKFGSPERVFTAPQSELKEVPGIGEKISEAIRRVLTSRYDAEGD